MEHKPGLIISLYLLIGLLLIGGYSKSRKIQLQQLNYAPDRGEMSWHIRKAKIGGEKEVALSGLHICPGMVLDLADALSQFRVLVAKPVERFTTIQEFWIVTWYKFKVIEDLSSPRLDRAKQYGCCGCEEDADCSAYFPAALLPLEADEILIPHIGGNLLIDGIKVIQPSIIAVDFSTGTNLENRLMRIPAETPEALRSHQRLMDTDTYLLFASVSKSGKVANLSGGRGIFALNAQGELNPVGVRSINIIKPWLDQLQIDSVDKLRSYIEQEK